jgi:hypothetical protein
VIGDGVNPVAESRRGWRDVARAAAVHILEVEVVCSDEREHRRRVKARVADIAGFVLPSWSSIQAHIYRAWTTPRLVVDTALLGPEDAVVLIEARMNEMVRTNEGSR